MTQAVYPASTKLKSEGWNYQGPVYDWQWIDPPIPRTNYQSRPLCNDVTATRAVRAYQTCLLPSAPVFPPLVNPNDSRHILAYCLGANITCCYRYSNFFSSVLSFFILKKKTAMAFFWITPVLRPHWA